MALRKQEAQLRHTESGPELQRVPADVRLLSAQGLEVDESPLTRESFAVIKDASWVGSDSTTLACRQNMAFNGAIDRPVSPSHQ